MKKIFEIWITYKGKTRVLKRVKESYTCFGWIVAKDEVEAKRKFKRRVDYKTVKDNIGRYVDVTPPISFGFKVEGFKVTARKVKRAPTFEEVKNNLTIDDFLEYIKNRID